MTLQTLGQTVSLLNVLYAGSYLSSGTVRVLNAADGKAFTQTLAEHLPEDWDLMEGLAALSTHFRESDSRYHPESFDFYGPWRPVGEKDVNATLRSLSMYGERWEGSKEACLLHPLGNRSNPIIQAAELYLGGRNIIDHLSESLRWDLVLPRLEVESFIVDLYLDRLVWQESLRPDLAPAERSRHFAGVGLQNERLKRAIKVVSDHRNG
jgi:hypothetical protein